MNPKDYLRYFSDSVRLRVRFEVEKGKVIEFVVQLEAKEGEGWLPVVRYDTTHGFAHRDRYRTDGSVVKHEPIMGSDFNEALTYAIRDIRMNWPAWLRDFGRGGE
jgi:hypothetical protein